MTTGFPCITCSHYRGGATHGNCTRPMTMQDGEILKLPRLHQTERDERSLFWKSKRRAGGDICGKSGKHWRART